MSVKRCLNAVCQSLNPLEILEVYRALSPHLLCKVESLLLSVYSYNVLDAHCAENCDTDQTDGAASLYNNSAVESQDSCCLCSLYSMNQYCTWFDQDSGLQVQVAYVEYGRTLTDHDVI